MSLASLATAAALAGLAGSPHCVAMCGAACAGLGSSPRRALAFQAGRLCGYALLGGAAAASAGALQWAAGQATLLKPFWAMFHVAVVLLGASLAWLGTQPAWLERGGQQLWRALRVRTLDLDPARLPLAAGALWALLPCGLLYSALMLALLADSPLEGMVVMASFGLTSGTVLQLGSSLLRRTGASAGRWGVRAAGVALMAASAGALAHGLQQEIAALCGLGRLS